METEVQNWHPASLTVFVFVDLPTSFYSALLSFLFLLTVYNSLVLLSIFITSSFSPSSHPCFLPSNPPSSFVLPFLSHHPFYSVPLYCVYFLPFFLPFLPIPHPFSTPSLLLPSLYFCPLLILLSSSPLPLLLAHPHTSPVMQHPSPSTSPHYSLSSQ